MFLEDFQNHPSVTQENKEKQLDRLRLILVNQLLKRSIYLSNKKRHDSRKLRVKPNKIWGNTHIKSRKRPRIQIRRCGSDNLGIFQNSVIEIIYYKNVVRSKRAMKKEPSVIFQIFHLEFTFFNPKKFTL